MHAKSPQPEKRRESPQQPVTINALVHRFRLGGDLHLGAQRLGDGVKGRQVADVLLPQVRIKDAHVRSARRQGGHVSQLGFEDVSGTCIATERRGHLLLRHLKLHLLQRLGTFSGSLLQGFVGLHGDASRLWVEDLLRGAFHQRVQLGHQREHLCRVLDELAHSVHDLAARAFHLLVLIVQATHYQGHGNCQSRGLHILHENASGQLLQAGVGLVNRRGSINHGWEERFQILVSSAFADGRHALQCRYLHLLLDVAGQVSHRNSKVDQQVAHGTRSFASQGGNYL
mmetsp:Transcript_9863/g.21033  ORF Transcript_9863/g.21033 Transcript_9863/m.21033 type:complete len:285 (+) Transcript_9863:119-973(+)